MPKGYYPRNQDNERSELIERIRRAASEGLSGNQIASIEGLTRAAVAGICSRNNIHLHGQQGRPRNLSVRAQPKPPTTSNLPAKLRPKAIVELPMSEGVDPEYRRQGKVRHQPTCCWQGCKAPTELGKPFCTTHAKQSKGG